MTYKVEINEIGDSDYIIYQEELAELSIVITDLTESTVYSFRLSSRNDVGFSQE